MGEPGIVFVRSSGGRADDAALADSMMSAALSEQRQVV
jgi:hypothetical protein